MNPQPNNSADTELKPHTELNVPDVPDVVEQKVVSGVNTRNKEVKRLPIGNGKYVKVCHYRKRPYVNIRDYATTVNGQLYATKRGILLKSRRMETAEKVC